MNNNAQWLLLFSFISWCICILTVVFLVILDLIQCSGFLLIINFIGFCVSVVTFYFLFRTQWWDTSRFLIDVIGVCSLCGSTTQTVIFITLLVFFIKS